MSNIFTTIKAMITTRQAAEFYGFKVRKNGMMCCPFHNDKNPSMKVDERYYCFGCQEKGDVIDFVAKVFELPAIMAAQKLAKDFGIDPDSSAVITPEKGLMKWQKRKDESYCAELMTNYVVLLQYWMEKYFPNREDNKVDECYSFACHEYPQATDTLDDLYLPDDVIPGKTAERLRRNGEIKRIETFLKEHEKEAIEAHATSGNVAAA